MERYLGRLSGPLLDRIDLHVEVPAVPYDDLRASAPGTGSAAMRERVIQARAVQSARYRGTACRANADLNGALLGFTREEIDAMYDDIVEFAELEDFMDQKLKNYSSGMQVRLAFSVAIKAQGDILVLDEVLAVGDEAFQRKCDNFFAQMKKDPTKTIILVTHSMDAVKRYCDKAILIKDGEIVVSGNKDDVADQYTLENLKVQEAEQKAHAAAVNAGTEYRPA